MTRFFVHPDQIQAGSVILDGDDAHHLRAVLHALPGDKIAILDGSGVEYSSVLESVGKTRAIARLGDCVTLATEPRTRITIAQALPKMAEKMEQVLQRGTEIGASAFWGYSSARSLAHFTGERQDKRLTRWRAIVKTAAEQSHRALLPAVRADHDFAGVLSAATSFDLALLANEAETQTTLKASLSVMAPAPASILIIIGPEGGFTKEEISAAERNGIHSITLGPRILRTETAAMVLAAQILCLLE